MTPMTIQAIREETAALPDDYIFTIDPTMVGEWKLDPADTSSTDNTGTILKTDFGQRIKRMLRNSYISIKWFGAAGDGVTDDTTAIQTAYNFCKANFFTLYLDAGRYKVNTLQFDGRVNVAGANTKEVVFRPAGNDMVIINHFDSANRSGGGWTQFSSHLSNFTIDGAGKTGITGLRSYLTLASTFTQVTIINCDRYGLLAEGTQYSVFDQVICELNFIGIRLIDDVSYDDTPVNGNGGGVNNEFRTCTARNNTVGVMLGRPANPYPFNLNRFTNLISKSNRYTAFYAINTGVCTISELGAESNATSGVASVTITNGGAGYTSVPTVTFQASPGGTNQTATGTAVITGGVLTAINITKAGNFYEVPPTITITGGAPTTPATATANLVDEFTVVETLGNINGQPLTINSVIKRSAIHTETSNINFTDYNHSQRNATIYALNYSALSFDGMQGAAITTLADETSSITVHNGRGGNGTVLTNTEVSQTTTPNFYAQFSVINTARYQVNEAFMNETVPSKVPEYIGGATNTQVLPYTTGSPFGGALETKFFASVGSTSANRVTLKTRPTNYANNEKIYVQFLIKANVDTLIRANLANNTVSPRIQLYAGKWKRVVLVNKNTSGNTVSSILQFYPLDTVGATISICNVASCTNLSEQEATLFIEDFYYNPNTPGGVDALFLNAPPTTGTWAKGDTVYNNNLADQGNTGWICITAGTPGVWVSFGPLGNGIKTMKGTTGSTGVETSFSFPHGLGAVPSWVGGANPRSTDAVNAGVKWVDADSTHLIVYVNTTPVAGTNNLVWDLQCKK